MSELGRNDEGSKKGESGFADMSEAEDDENGLDADETVSDGDVNEWILEDGKVRGRMADGLKFMVIFMSVLDDGDGDDDDDKDSDVLCCCITYLSSVFLL